MEIIKHNGNTESAIGAALAERRKEYVGQWLSASFERWMDAVLSDNELSERSLRIYRRTYERWAAFCEADPDIRSPKMLTLEYIDRFISAQTCGLQTKYFMLCHMARMLSWASDLLRGYEIELARLKKRREGLLKKVRRLKVKHSTKGKLSPAQIAVLLTAWDGDKSYIGVRNAVVIHLLLYTGLRRSELAALRWDNIFRVNEEYVVRVAKGKGDKEREVLVFDPSPRTVELMERLHRMQWWGERQFMFTAAGRDKHIQHNQVANILRQTVEWAREQGIEMPDLTPHDLRSEFATIANRSGVELLNIKEQLGHENIQTTQDYFKIEAATERRYKSQFPDLAEDGRAARIALKVARDRPADGSSA